MAGKRSWCTKADIMKDLYQVSGKTGDVDEEFIIMGQKPPPPRRFEDDDDDEIQSRFGVLVNSSLSSDQEQHSPDLQGITNLLRMVNDYNEVESETQEAPPPSSPEAVYISKLDPSVPEFVPKGMESSNSDSKENKFPNEQSCDKQETLIKTEVEQKEEEIDIGKKLDVSKLNADQINHISKKLRSKISDVANKDNLHSKRERNVAIATLLKIYSSAPKEPEEPPVPEVSDKPLKLLSPQYFERPLANKQVEESQDEDKNLLNNTNSSQELSQTNGDSTTIEEEDVANAVPLVEKVPVENKHYEDDQVRESINKVNRWFQTPKSPKPKGPVVCLGPIEFKRKSNPRSPISSDIESKRSTPTKPVINQYKPSKYASELSKTFHDRVKTKVPDDLWERTYMIMKEKEEKMKLKKMEQSMPSGDDSTTEDQASSSVSFSGKMTSESTYEAADLGPADSSHSFKVQNTDGVTKNDVQNKTTEQENVSLNNDNVEDNKAKNVLLINEPSSMFKKKKVQKANAISDKKENPSIQKIVTSVNTYQPSTHADKYCQKFEERNKMKEVIKDDVWSRAMKVMQKIDSKKKLDAVAKANADAVATTSPAMNAVDLTGYEETISELSIEFAAIDKMSSPSQEVYHLPQHRHLLTGECLVCNVFKKNGINIDFEALSNNESDNFTLSIIKFKKDADRNLTQLLGT